MLSLSPSNRKAKALSELPGKHLLVFYWLEKRIVNWTSVKCGKRGKWILDKQLTIMLPLVWPHTILVADGR